MRGASGSLVQLCVLGQFRLIVPSDDRGRLTFGASDFPTAATSVLKLLAIHPTHSLHREQVVDALWPEANPERGFNSLYKALHHLRSKLTDNPKLRDLVSVERQRVRLADWVAVDLDDFRRLTQLARHERGLDAWTSALDTYAGPLLADDPYPWLERPRVELAQLHRECQLEVAEGYIEQGDGHLRAAIALFYAVLDDTPADERAHRGLMRTFAAQGDFARASQQYETCKTTLTDPVGRDPATSTQRLHDEILQTERATLSARATAPLPAVRFVTTGDEVRLAYQAFGRGFPLVHVTQSPFNHLQREWDVPLWRDWYLALADGRRLMRYDGRGMGLSTREVDDLSAEAFANDLAVVVDAADLDQFDLYGGLNSSPIVIAYAARYPERVRRIVLWAPCASGAELLDLSVMKAGREIARDWPWYCHSSARLLLGFPADEAVNQVAASFLDSSDATFLHRWYTDYLSYDVSCLLSKVRSPTLVLHSLESPLPSTSSVERVVEGLSSSTVISIEGRASLPIVDTERIAKHIHGFLDEV